MYLFVLVVAQPLIVENEVVCIFLLIHSCANTSTTCTGLFPYIIARLMYWHALARYPAIDIHMYCHTNIYTPKKSRIYEFMYSHELPCIGMYCFVLACVVMYSSTCIAIPTYIPLKNLEFMNSCIGMYCLVFPCTRAHVLRYQLIYP